ncbi:MAG: type II secretion system protein GspE [Gammaproteobacteria bacterium]|nr:type II secretion system protein GspE [Gammaproteobacteria bacterium]
MSDAAFQGAVIERSPVDLPFSFCRRHRVILDDIDGDGATIVYQAPLSADVIAELSRHLDRPLRLVGVDETSFERRLSGLIERDPGDAAERIIEDMDESGDLIALAGLIPDAGDLLESAEDAPVVRLVNAILTRALREGASDVHLEPYESRVAVRFRVDGMLREVLSPQRALAPVLAARVKIMASLDIAERRLPQDGRISLRVAGQPIDVRVSTMPSGHGERVVLRLLEKDSGALDLAELGMGDGTVGTLVEVVSNPHGVLLVTGPTGSGKTTTLYALINRLNDNSRNILTVEEPIEYYIDGIGQTQVNRKVDMSFARGLRAILRQDPDVVMVGEIRDLETAEVAVQASLTGHLVMSTLHTNTAVGAVTRLRDMGVESFLLSASLVGVIAQRLVRCLCTQCRRPYEPCEEEARAAGMAGRGVLFAAVGCHACAGTGYRGRSGLFELVPVDNDMRGLIHEGAPQARLEAHARRYCPSLLADGQRLVQMGKTSLSELQRVAKAV